jgi:hypothetical protein
MGFNPDIPKKIGERTENMNCNCEKQDLVIFGIKNPEKVLNLDLFKLIKKHPNNPDKYYYQCKSCGQNWEKQANHHPDGYTENWKKLENIPQIPVKN